MAINVHIFDPTSLTPEKKQRLESLLDQIDAVTLERRTAKKAANVKSLEAWLEKPVTLAPGVTAFTRAVPEDRFPAYVAEIAEWLGDTQGAAEALARVKSLPVNQQIEAVAAMSVGANVLIDPALEKKQWYALDRLYKTVLAEYPGILLTPNDVVGALELGKALHEHKNTLKAAWQDASVSKTETAKALLAIAYPDEDTEHVHVAAVDTKRAAAGFITSKAADTIACGGLFTNARQFSFPMYLFAHEYQHRRQLLLADRLERGEITKDAPEYYQARLFRANFDGGYLTPMNGNKLSMLARLSDYYDQPIEAQANELAKLASAVGGTGGDIMWKMTEKLNRAFSAVASPVHTVAEAVSSITRISKPKAKTP